MNYQVNDHFKEEVAKYKWHPGENGHLSRSWSKGGKARAKPYAAKVCHKGKQIYCGYYLTPEEASQAADSKRNELSLIESLS
jgi:hypothetical protein